LHDRRTIRTALAAFKGNIYKKNIYVPEVSYPTTKKIYKGKGATYQQTYQPILSTYQPINKLSLTPHAQFLRSKIDHISENLKQNSKRL
jgi:hypothetical protein